MTTITEKELIRRVACKLAGRPVEVRFEEPPYSTAAGSAHKTAAGAVIYVNPGMPGDEQFKVMLHELAHCRLHYNRMPAAGHEKAPARSIPSDPDHRIGKVLGFDAEGEADRLADRWWNYTENNGGPYLVPARGDKPTARLLALLDSDF